MVDLQSVRLTNSALVHRQPLVAVFTGGTSGIGEYTIRGLAAHHGKTGKGLRVYIVGRNEEAANKIISDCLKICPTEEFIFLKASDLSLLREVDRVCEKIRQLEEVKAGESARIDLMVMSHADLWFGERRETEEGLDKTMSFLFYSRMRFITKLLPLLRASTLPAHVVSIYGAGLEKGLPNWQPNNLSLRGDDKTYSKSACRTHVIVMTTFYFERLAQQNAGKVSLTHEYPGLVMTPAFVNPSHPWWFRLIWTIVSPVIHFFRPVIPAEETGKRVLFLCGERFPPRSKTQAKEYATTADGLAIATSTDGVRGNGAYSEWHTGETNDVDETYIPLRRDGFGDKIWKHTNEAFDAIERGERFTG
ncbi:hypothetical protein M409DRAFT_70530 [Zasmidium cellare ATCC 36951]|uniref:Ketoreductase (KR) domain-containing protein n=1 Tax=Zasmidium cellare ATCC 36951 TaxID=1080233 RepID=A0A6A6C285_ZASCE|nr:uncharacterized protein M409DRAFT_70530 [Zasmidium cellare ATCC 36951]KAF2160378.1 hypothetical protein M409DRAFT_70530 [Zasmidium cellare ATCC 36951]